MTKFLQRRIVTNFLGDSQFDDANIKQLTREYLSYLELLKKATDFPSLRYNQGCIAILEKVIVMLREQNKKDIIAQSNEGEEST